MAIETLIHKEFIENRWTLSLAESCTGGALSARLTQQPGASSYFLGSIVAYSNDIKSSVLGVSKELLERYGAVSHEVAEAMTLGVLQLSKSDFSLAVTGIAGPTGGTPDKPVGTIWAGLGHRSGKVHIWRFHVDGSRQQVIDRTVDIILNELLNFAKKP